MRVAVPHPLFYSVQCKKSETLFRGRCSSDILSALMHLVFSIKSMNDKNVFPYALMVLWLRPRSPDR